MESSQQQAQDLFISYASADRDLVFRVVEAIESLGVSVWIDKSGIAGGAAYGGEIVEAIRSSRAIALMSTEASLGSKNVRQEIMLAWRYGTPILPLMLEAVSPPDDVSYWLEGFPWIDVRGEFATWLPELARRLQQHGVTIDAAEDRRLDASGTLPAYRTNLPSVDGGLFGRQQAIREIESLLDHGRWITLTGPGGTGKTRLAIEIGKRQITTYEDGVWFIDLAPIDTPGQVLASIVDALALDAHGESDVEELLLGALAEQRMLLIVDNFEQVADGAGVLARLQEQLPALDILATSRMALRTPLEWPFEVPQLPLPDASGASTAAQLAQHPAVALFVEKAKLAKPDFVLSEGNARAIAEICARLEGLPLAIELAAARIRLLPPQVLLARLGSRLSLLSRSGDNMRARTLHDTIRWSYDLLSPDQQELFELLGVFRGPSAADDIAQVSDWAEAHDGLQVLLDHSLLKVASVRADHAFRISMLETIREFAVLQLDASAAASNARERHARFFAAKASAEGAKLAHSTGGNLLPSLRADDANLHAAIDHLLSVEDMPAAVDMLTTLYAYWLRTARSADALAKLSAALDGDTALPVSLRARASLDVARYHDIRGDAERAQTMLKTAYHLASESHDHVLEGHVLFEMARKAARQNRVNDAADYYSRSADCYQTAGRKEEQAESLHALGVLHIYAGDFPAAIEAISASVESFRSMGDLRMVGEALSDLGAAEMLAGNATAAQKHLRDSLAIFRTMEDEMAIAVLTTNLGRALQIAGDLESARTTLSEALELTRKAGDRANEAVTLYGLGLLARSTGQPDESDRLLRKALEIAWGNGDLWLVVEILEAIAHLEIGRGEFEIAISHLGAAMAMRDESGTAVNPSEQAEHEHAVTLATSAVGAARFAELVAAGRSIPVEVVVQQLLFPVS